MEHKTEAQLQAEIALAGNKGGTRLFKNVGGNFWQGKLLDITNNIAKLAKPKRIKCGLVTGAADRIGFHQVTITPDMIGKKIPVFAAVELKKHDGRLSPEQQNFIKFILDMNGIAGVVRSVDDLKNLLDSYSPK
jgi:hypothetical protein